MRFDRPNSLYREPTAIRISRDRNEPECQISGTSTATANGLEASEFRKPFECAIGCLLRGDGLKRLNSEQS